MTGEVVVALAPARGGRYLDATIGLGGHAEALLEAGPESLELLGVDRDRDALEIARSRLTRFGGRVHLEHAAFDEIASLMQRPGWIDGVDGILLDLGVSSLQLDTGDRGFSFRHDGPLDMRMDRSSGRTAAELVAETSERELADLIYRFGEETASRRIARAIVNARTLRPLATTADLRAAVLAAGVRGRPGHDPSTRTFQALRIAVNGELEQLESLLDDAWRLLRASGRMAVLTYHSLEDRLVKKTFRSWAAKCICPPVKPFCDCGWTPKVRLLSSRLARPSEAEIARNPRARSAGLRVVERIAG
jgi:16S rRNA (cytosine1402-N4)-methyltransferase